MSKLLEFFKSKNLERRFSRLGEGRKLGDRSERDEGSQIRPVEIQESMNVQIDRPAVYSSAASAAADAAMERINQQNKRPGGIYEFVRFFDKCLHFALVSALTRFVYAAVYRQSTTECYICRMPVHPILDKLWSTDQFCNSNNLAYSLLHRFSHANCMKCAIRPD